MDDELLKRRTDCVYFLASPLTCKKGSECEFRHSEAARLNPRDCWYWRNGNCRNPACAFRHPPLEGFTKQGPNSVQSTPHAAAEPSKPNVPCYFFFNAYCIKGDQCPFLHEIPPKTPKTAPEPTPTNPPQTKTSTGSDTGPASVEVPATTNPSESTSGLVKQSHSKEAQGPAPVSVSEESSPSSESSARECEELGIKMRDSPLPPVEYINGSNEHEHPSPDPSSEEPDKDMVEHDEWWESSPGFDVLVDDGSEHLAYPDDTEYLLAQERESEMLHSHLLQYDFEDSAGYDPMGYPNVGYDPYERLEGRHTPEYFEEQSREMFLGPIIHWKRKGPHSDCGDDARGGADLRDLLRKRRRVVDVHHASQSSRKHRPSQARGSSRERSVRRASQARGNSRERPVRRGMGPRLRGRLSSEVGTSVIGSGESESLWDDHHRRGWSGHPHLDRHRERESRRRHAKSPPIHSEFTQSSASKDAKSRLVTAGGFSGPKTLEQIREEKRAIIGSRDRSPTRTVRDDFEGPKPLNELLKNKRKPGSQAGKGVADGEGNLLSYHGSGEKLEGEYDSEFLDDDGDFDLS